MNIRSISKLFLALSLAAIVTSCATPRMYVDDELRSSADTIAAVEIPASNGTGNMMFGDYKVMDIFVKGGAKKSGFKMGGFGKTTVKVDQEIQFKFMNTKMKTTYNASCRRTGESNDGKWSADTKSSYACDVKEKGKTAFAFDLASELGASKWALSYKGIPTESAKIKGKEIDQIIIRSSPVQANEDGTKKGVIRRTLGYNFMKDGKVIAAAEASGEFYNFYVHKNIKSKKRDLLAIASAAVQLSQKIAINQSNSSVSIGIGGSN